MKIKLLCIIPLFLSSFASAEEWSAPIGKKQFGAATKKLPGVVSEKLDFGAYSTEDELVVFLRNGKHKMGGRSITIEKPDSPVTLEFQRVRIARPLSSLTKKGDGTHLFEIFANSDKPYEIYYTIKGGELEPTITVSSKS